MRKISYLSIFLALFASLSMIASAQGEGAIKPVLKRGEVTAVSAGKIVVKTEDGATVEAVLSDKTVYKRVPPDNPKTPVDSSFAEIGVGDKVVLSIVPAESNQGSFARTVYLMTKSDISQKQAKEQEQWRTRGVSGRVTAVNPQTKEITITTPGLMGGRSTVLSIKDNAEFLRYAQDSASYNEAKKSSFEEVAVGDTLRAIGDKSEDGATLKAEKILTGAFQTIAGTVTAVDAAKGEVTINNIQTKKDVVIVIGKGSVLKQFPAEQAQRMAQMQMAAAANNGGGNMVRPPQQQQQQQGNQTQQQNPSLNQQQGGGNRGGSLDDLLERFPTIKLEDLKVGEMIAVSSTKTVNQDRVTAIKLVSGIEPFTKVPQMANNGGGGGNRGGGGVNSSFSIPGLDGGGGLP